MTRWKLHDVGRMPLETQRYSTLRRTLFGGGVHDRRGLLTTLRRPRGTNPAEIARARGSARPVVAPPFVVNETIRFALVLGGNTHRVI